MSRSGSSSSESVSEKSERSRGSEDQISRSILELEVRIKQEMKEQLAPMLIELGKMQQNFGRVFNALQGNDTVVGGITGKLDKMTSTLEKASKEQELMRRKLEAVERLQKNSEKHGYTPGPGVRRGAYQNQQGISRSGPIFNRFHSRVLAQFETKNEDLPINANDNKIWTSRGEGVYTSDENSSQSEQDDNEVVGESSITNSSASKKTIATIKSDVVEDPPVLAPKNKVEKPKEVDALKESAKASSASNNEQSESKSDGVEDPPVLAPKATTSGLIGGFGGFRRGKPASFVQPIVKPSTAPEDKSANNDGEPSISLPIGGIGEIEKRPLTIDELRVLGLVGKSSSPKVGSFFGKGTGAIIAASAVENRSFGNGSPGGRGKFGPPNGRQILRGGARVAGAKSYHPKRCFE